MTGTTILTSGAAAHRRLRVKRKNHWIQKAVKHPGVEEAAAKRAHMTTHAYMEKEKDAPGKAGARARLGLRFERGL